MCVYIYIYVYIYTHTYRDKEVNLLQSFEGQGRF